MNLLAIIPMPIFLNSGGGSVEPNAQVGFLIACNIFMLAIFIVRSLIWMLSITKKQDWTFTQYTIWSDMDLFTPDINTGLFVCVNGCAILIWLAIEISKML